MNTECSSIGLTLSCLAKSNSFRWSGPFRIGRGDLPASRFLARYATPGSRWQAKVASPARME